MDLIRSVETNGNSHASDVFRCSYLPDGQVAPPGNPQNLFEVFQASVEKHRDLPALGYRPIVNGQAQPYKYLTYQDVSEKVAQAGSAFRAKGIKPGVTVGICSKNCPEWAVSMKGLDWAGGICVPVYDTFGNDAIKFILEHSEMRMLMLEAAKLSMLAKVLPAFKGKIVQVVVWSSEAGTPVDQEMIKTASASGVPVVSWDDFLAGAGQIGQPSPGTIDSLCTIMYTSGTTGEPKGVEISHRSAMTTLASIVLFQKHINIFLTEGDVFLSYLPLAHILDRIVEEAMLASGASIGYWQGNPKLLMDDIAALRPTFFVGVPRIFDRVYSGVTDKVSKAGFISRMLFKLAFAIKRFFVKRGVLSLPVVDQVVFKKIKDRLGGRVRVIISGGAPLAEHVEMFLKVTMCCPCGQGYGLTETCGASFLGNPKDPHQALTVGTPIGGLDFKLVSVPEMGYDATADPPCGEICMRGPPVFTGYHKRPDLTSEVLTEDGWFHTGDVGTLTSTGAMRIIDRKKNIFKLSQGEYVAAEKLENIYKQVALVDQIWVHGDSDKAQVVAVVVPAEATLMSWAKDNNVDGDFKAVCAASAAVSHVQSALEAQGRGADLKGFEIVRGLHLSPEPFSVDNDLITPSFKLKRPQLRKAFAGQIKDMYAKLNP